MKKTLLASLLVIVLLVSCLTVVATTSVSAAARYDVFKDGAFQNGASALSDSSTGVRDGVLTNLTPESTGGWFQINSGDDTVGGELKYLVFSAKSANPYKVQINLNEAGWQDIAAVSEGGVDVAKFDYQQIVIDTSKFNSGKLVGWITMHGFEPDIQISEMYYTDTIPSGGGGGGDDDTTTTTTTTTTTGDDDDTTTTTTTTTTGDDDDTTTTTKATGGDDDTTTTTKPTGGVLPSGTNGTTTTTTATTTTAPSGTNPGTDAASAAGAAVAVLALAGFAVVAMRKAKNSK